MKKYFLLILLSLSGCSSQIENASNPIQDLINNRWMLVWIDDEIIADLSIPVYFKIEKDSTVKGFAGCNEFWGNVSFSQKKISFSKIAATRMFCDRMNLETKLLSLMQNKNNWRIEADSLYLLYEEKLSLKFIKLFLK